MIRRLLGEHLFKAGIASTWIVAGRVLGLAWTLAIIMSLGISDFGRYAMAFSLAALIAAPLDSTFHVRTIRIEVAQYRAERTSRAIVGALLFAVGCALYAQFFVVGFALIVAGGEIAFNAYKSQALRDGHPNVVMRMDVFRQAVSIAVAGVYVFVAPVPALEVASLFYLAPYLVVLLLAARSVRRFAPKIPGRPKEMSLLGLDAFFLMLHYQGDILLLGLLTDSTIVGYYSVATTLALAATSFAQMYAHTFNEPLRLAGGDPAAGPGTRSLLILSGLLGLMVLITGLVLFATGLSPQIAISLMIMSAFVVMRCVTGVMTTILYVQARDRQRVLGGAVAATVKLTLVTALATFGAPGASSAAVLAEVLLVIWYCRAVYSRGSEPRSSEREIQIVKDGTL